MMPTLQHYRQIDIIRQAEHDFFSNTGIKPFDISHWNSGDEYKKLLMQTLILPDASDYIDYSYSFSFCQDIKSAIISKHKASNASCVLCASATAAIATVCTALKAMNNMNFCLIQPAYFSAFEQLTALNLNVQCINYTYDGQYHIPFDLIDSNTDVVWITQPVFSTGTYIDSAELQQLFETTQFVVLDGSMCDTIYDLPTLDIDYAKCILLFSPHKVIGVNGIKFSYILCNKAIAKILEDWEDVIVGGLSYSNIVAINHYLSENYVHCLDAHNNYIEESHLQLDKIIQHSNAISKCGISLNNTYETLSIKKFKYVEQIKFGFMYDFITHTHVSLIPGCINGFDSQNGFCFRINHTLDINKNAMALNRIIAYLKNL